MEADTYVNIVKNLGRSDFNKIVDLVLEKAFKIVAVDVDGRGDGGTDRRVFTDSGGSTTVAYQVTVQKHDWKRKAITDAETAVNELGATRYFFLTSREHGNADLRSVENEITSRLGIAATCLGAKEIAQLLIKAGLEKMFFEVLNIYSPENLSTRPDLKEILLHSYLVLSTDRRELSDTVYEDTILLALYTEARPLARQELTQKALDILGCDRSRISKLEKRVDSLLSRGILISGNAGLVLLADKIDEIELAEQVYEKEFADLCEILTESMEKEFDIKWDSEAAREISLLLAKVFIKGKLDVARNASIKLTSLGLMENIGNPMQDMRDFLQQKGVPVSEVEKALKILVDLGKDVVLIKRLSRAALFVAIEGSNPVSIVKALGTSEWKNVKVFLDTSVAIPYLCANIFRPTRGRFSSTSVACIESLVKFGADTRIPYFYLRECAGHLLLALKYGEINTEEFGELRLSTNGFVSHYYALRSEGVSVPENLTEYLSCFAEAVNRHSIDKTLWEKRIRSDLQRRFREYGIEYEEVPSNVSDHYRRDIEIEYGNLLDRLKRKKPHLLLQNDVTILSHMSQLVSQELENCMCLTWDGTMIGVGKELAQCGWVVSPIEAAELSEMMKPISSSQFCSLAHSLAIIHERPLEVAARILDRIVKFAGEKLQDWEFKKKIKEFRSELISRIDIGQDWYADFVDKETDRFLISEGVQISKEIDEYNLIDGSI